MGSGTLESRLARDRIQDSFHDHHLRRLAKGSSGEADSIQSRTELLLSLHSERGRQPVTV